MEGDHDSTLHCPICKKRFTAPVMVPQCAHSFCAACVDALPTEVVPVPKLETLKRLCKPLARPPPNPPQATCPCCPPDTFRTFVPSTCLPNKPLERLLSSYSEDEPPEWPSNAEEDEVEENACAKSLVLAQAIPYGLAECVGAVDGRVGMRIYILDNSGSTANHDGQWLPSVEPGNTRTIWPVSCTRWEEIKRMAYDQAEYNIKCGVPCTFFLLNPRSRGYCGSPESAWENVREGVDFCSVRPAGASGEQQVAGLRSMLDAAGPMGVTPLADCIRMVGERIYQAASALSAKNQMVFLTLVTDGVPTTATSSQPTSYARHAMIKELRHLTSSLPIILVIRLATSDDAVVEFWNNLDSELEFPLDVLDDVCAESKEVYQCGNRWLTYSPYLHTMREGGTNIKLLDLLDERRFTGGEVATFCQLVLLGPDDPPLPPWQDVEVFCEALNDYVRRTPLVYSPLLKRMTPILNMREVKVLLQRDLQRKGRPGGFIWPSAIELAVLCALAAIVLHLLWQNREALGAGLEELTRDQPGTRGRYRQGMGNHRHY